MRVGVAVGWDGTPQSMNKIGSQRRRAAPGTHVGDGPGVFVGRGVKVLVGVWVGVSVRVAVRVGVRVGVGVGGAML